MTGPNDPQRQLSPDGRWWWDGQKWQPVEQAPTAGPPPSQRPAGTSRKALLIGVGVGAGVLLLLGLCVAAIGSTSSTKSASVAVASPSPTPTPTPTAAKTPTTAPAAAPTKDGSCAPQPCANDNYGWIVVVSNFRYGVSSTNQFEKPEAGNTYVTLEVTFNNKLAREQHANPTTFVLLDGAGVKHTVTSTTFCSLWSAVNVTTGASYGPKCLAFEAAADKPSGLALVWTPSGFGGGYNMKLS